MSDTERLNAEIKALRGRIILNDTLHQDREKILLAAISKANRAYKREVKKVESLQSNRELIHLREIVKNQGLRITELNRKINDFYR